jgi:hypothetical protein
MSVSLGRLVRVFGFSLLAATIAFAPSASVGYEPVVPGTGEKVEEAGDDFEDPDWAYTFNLPKSSKNIDGRTRNPNGKSNNGRWFESNLRGEMDVIKRVPTPEGGIEGSEGSLLLRTLQSGSPGSPTYQMQQDDLILNVTSRVGGYIPMSWMPSVTVRVFVPPFEEWEQRTGTSFGFRCELWATNTGNTKEGKIGQREPYWPGMFIQLVTPSDRRVSERHGLILVRSGINGGDLMGPKITEPGWWTLGMSYTPDGRVHYYASPGVDDLTAEDYITSQYPYGFRAERFETFFFNVANRDDGRTWSTAWIIDDPSLYFVRRGSYSYPNNSTVRRSRR